MPPRPRPGILDIEPYVPGNVNLPEGVEPVFLASNESPLGPSPAAREAFARCAGRLHRYPDGSSRRLRRALAERWGLDPDGIVLGPGSERLIDLVARAYAGPGDEVLYSAHGFLMYPIAARAGGATPVAAAERDLTADPEALLAAVTPRTRILFLANPNNPTGTWLPRARLRALRAALPESVLLVIDAAYAEYVDAADYDPGHGWVRTPAENTVVLHTFSKIHGLAALRIGWAWCPPSVARVLDRIRGSFPISHAAEEAALAALADTEHLAAAQAHNRRWRPWLAERLAELGLSVTPSAANFVLVRFGSAARCRAALRFLAEHGVIVRPMDAYALPDALRITVGQAHENEILVDTLKRFLESEAHHA
ncbi:MAG: histidinol-phosphate aminotransferase 2 [Gammaproteobacteria bacterium]|nr:MAG: histidinol-phosphate aminotransferase 2 [Gammaproteobacteria bacterium]